MVKIVKCSYCGKEMPPGKGKTFVRINGEILYFCTEKCQKYKIKLGKPARTIRWTLHYGKK
jgi:large subunit ribosomal protein L24e